MTTRFLRAAIPAGWLALLAGISVLLTGCASTPKVDWNARIGSYTYDQAVAENGPPDKQATLSNGDTVAEWIRRRSGGGSISFGTGFYGSGVGVGVGQTVGSDSRDKVLRLIFDGDGKLSAWGQN